MVCVSGNIDARIITVISARLVHYLQARKWYVINNKAFMKIMILLIYKRTLYCIILARIYKSKRPVSGPGSRDSIWGPSSHGSRN